MNIIGEIKHTPDELKEERRKLYVKFVSNAKGYGVFTKKGVNIPGNTKLMVYPGIIYKGDPAKGNKNVTYAWQFYMVRGQPGMQKVERNYTIDAGDFRGKVMYPDTFAPYVNEPTTAQGEQFNVQAVMNFMRTPTPALEYWTTEKGIPENTEILICYSRSNSNSNGTRLKRCANAPRVKYLYGGSNALRNTLTGQTKYITQKEPNNGRRIRKQVTNTLPLLIGSQNIQRLSAKIMNSTRDGKPLNRISMNTIKRKAVDNGNLQYNLKKVQKIYHLPTWKSIVTRENFIKMRRNVAKRGRLLNAARRMTFSNYTGKFETLGKNILYWLRAGAPTQGPMPRGLWVEKSDPTLHKEHIRVFGPHSIVHSSDLQTHISLGLGPKRVLWYVQLKNGTSELFIWYNRVDTSYAYEPHWVYITPKYPIQKAMCDYAFKVFPRQFNGIFSGPVIEMLQGRGKELMTNVLEKPGPGELWTDHFGYQPS